MSDCKNCNTETSEATLPDGQVIGQYCGDCHGITVDGEFHRFGAPGADNESIPRSVKENKPRAMTDNNPIERDWEQNDLEAWLESVRDEKSKALEMNDMDGVNYASGKETALITALEVIDYIRFELEDLATEWDNTSQYDDVREQTGPQAQTRCAKELERRLERLFNDGDTIRCPNCSSEARLDWLGDMKGVGIVCENCDTTVGYGGGIDG